MIQHALALAAEGFHVFPLHASGPKWGRPLHTGWQDEATCDPAAVRALWRHAYGIGISTSHGLLVVDVDIKHDKHGDQSLVALELAGYDLPPTREHLTPSGGRHLLYAVKEPVRQGVEVLGPGLDIRSRGGYIVAPGTRKNGIAYERDNYLPVAPAPQWLIDRCGVAPKHAARAPEIVSGIDPARATRRAIEWLQAQPAVTQGARNDAAFRAAAKVKDLGVPEAECGVLLLEYWPCEPMLDVDELATTIRSAYHTSQNPQGSAAPEAVFEAIDEDAALDPIEKLNKSYAFVLAGGGHTILWETTDENDRVILEHLREDSFHKKFAAVKLRHGDRDTPVTKAWMSSPKRRSYDRLVFAPERHVAPRFYNTWRGFTTQALDPAVASDRARNAVAAWREHVLVNLAQNDPVTGAWLLGYFAHMIQRPWEKPLTALVFKGRKGTGKNAAIDRVGQLFRSNYFVVDDTRYLTGNFNAHLEACLCLVLDEAQWAGDKRAEGRLKGLITGTDHLIERKGSEAYRIANLTRVVIVGNEEWLVPATEDERRFAVFNVGDGRRKDNAFFHEMREGMEADHGAGYGVLLHYLQSIDLSRTDLNIAPCTAGLLDQKLNSLSPAERWWSDSLESGRVLGLDTAMVWPTRVEATALYAAMQRVTRASGHNYTLGVSQFGRLMTKLCPTLLHERNAVAAEGYTYHVPPLGEACEAFARWIGGTPEWMQ